MADTEGPWIYFKGHFHAALIAVGRYPDDTFLWKSYRKTYCLKDHEKTCIIMVLTGASSSAFVTDPLGSGEHFQFIILCREFAGNFCSYEEIDSSLSVTEISSSRAVPSILSTQFLNL
ncbi:hypothetical protein CQW23_20533 [Capsicum baccatum]|uniref:Uncharacterized protein n=1 Tax=Capsicum baccatum TaxID=33114 RepID=A0A2G2W913_CAPBA|nr:hypothetical protein CQW23_20533 [Capsicum baccatum]